jgi:Zn-finger nucleic acid-binding protein
MSMVICPHCGARVFTITGWADLDHCPDCGRVLAPAGTIKGSVHETVRREARRFSRAKQTTEKDRS